MFKISFEEYFKSNTEITREEAMNYALKNTTNALKEAALNKNYDYFSRENNIREDLINCGYIAIRMELFKNAVKTYYYYRKKKTTENSEYYNTISMINIGLEKYGVGKTKVVFEDSDIVDKLCTSFITERIKYDHKSELDYVIDDEAKFLVASIDSYYSKNKEV